ncbi:phage major capsid protein [Agrobacterium rhizogenes]|uniref:phage major capsid protein n=1 Tax=Rhizobium rhizogenes TaxID=359 RepID=UPI00157429EE|nr:phage major capsid protein [Rhizobium rhizogenes]NTG85856.1 phage major capsid protein [Rhizobium rhizogenes]
MSKITELREKQQKLVADARSALADIKDDTAEARVAELESQHDAAMADYDKLEERIKREEAVEAREKALNEADERRPQGENRAINGGRREERTPEERYSEAFATFIRRGRSGLNAEQRALLSETEARAQSVGTQTAGGYLVPDQFQAELITALKAWGPMLNPGVTRMLNTATGASMTWPTFDDTNNEGTLIGENQQVVTTEVAFGTKTLDAYKYTSNVVLVSDELLQDAAMDVNGIINAAMAERIGRIGNRHLTVGDGANKPRGIVTAAGTTPAAAGGAITFDDMIELEHAVDPAYRSDPSVSWMFNDKTLKALRKLKDLQNNYIWQPADVKTGAPATILDYRYSINQAVPDIASGNKSVVFGALNRYIVRLVKEFAMKRLVERYADFGQVGFIGFTRLDGELMDTTAVKTLLHP